MTKGIREFANEQFIANMGVIAEKGPTAFRKAVMDAVVMQFGITAASAATHYNHALKQARIEAPDMVKGLGRPEGKKGGRKVLHTVDVIKVKTGEVVAAGISKGAATLLISKAAAQGKAKLAIKTEAPADEVAPAEVAMATGAMVEEAALV